MVPNRPTEAMTTVVAPVSEVRKSETMDFCGGVNLSYHRMDTGMLSGAALVVRELLACWRDVQLLQLLAAPDIELC
jgi:hypothetical protein